MEEFLNVPRTVGARSLSHAGNDTLQFEGTLLPLGNDARKIFHTPAVTKGY